MNLSKLSQAWPHLTLLAADWSRRRYPSTVDGVGFHRTCKKLQRGTHAPGNIGVRKVLDRRRRGPAPSLAAINFAIMKITRGVDAWPVHDAEYGAVSAPGGTLRGGDGVHGAAFSDSAAGTGTQ